MNAVIIIYSILLSLLIGGYITLLFEVRELKRFKDVFAKFMKSQQDLNNAQVEHDIKVIDIITKTQKDIGRLVDTIYYCEKLEKETGKEESDVRESDCVDGES